ncbi:MAG TPA: hypothetical protein VFG10_19845 [Saprospiraceae bacterium]|nr:hypothetical protein [Saprospiraceae bacterium]
MKTQTFTYAFVVTILLAIPLLSSGQNDLQYFRPYDLRGLNMFETPKSDNGISDDFKVRIGANFTQQFQSLDHQNTAEAVPTSPSDPTNINELIDLSPGFNLATANLNIDAQLERGIRLNVVAYLSSRHHQEAYVKGGYIQFDQLLFMKSALIDRLMNNFTIKLGHYEVNFGDAHFRRTDNGNAFHNPFVGGYILDAFNTEIGGEITYQKNGFIAMGGATNGEIKGDVVALPALDPENDVDDSSLKSPAWIGKLGVDKQLNNDLRVRLTGSVYYTASSRSNNLYGGDRAGSRYYLVMENTKATTNANHYSGRLAPKFTDKVASGMANLFMKYKGFEFFGTYENSNGRTSKEEEMRNATQWAGELIYRFGEREQFYVAGRYNKVQAELLAEGTNFGIGNPVKISRIQAGAGWYINNYILAKVEYVTQEYKDYSVKSIFSGGSFDGLVIEAAVAF